MKKKELIKITPAAAERIRYLMNKRAKPPSGIRIGVKSGGCSGLKYKFEYVDNTNVTDETITHEDITLMVEQTAIMHIVGTTLDYVDETVKAGFTFINPNAKNSCGCGESFNT